jgi:hypothetical protein
MINQAVQGLPLMGCGAPVFLPADHCCNQFLRLPFPTIHWIYFADLQADIHLLQFPQPVPVQTGAPSVSGMKAKEGFLTAYT